MAGIPSDIAGSALQAGFQARKAAQAGQSERAGQGQAASRAVDDSGNTIETSDNDAQVYADAEGTGSKGRVFEEDVLEPEDREDEQEESDGGTPPGEGGQHLDIEA